MRLLVAIKSCNRDIGLHDYIRATWGKDFPDVRFFVGRGDKPLQSDGVRLDCGDGYTDLPEKARAITGWSVEHGYDFTLIADNDTFIHPGRVHALPFDWDYFGRQYWYTRDLAAVEAPFRFVFSGLGFFLSRKACEIVSQAKLEETTNDDEWVGYTLQSSPIKAPDGHYTRFERWVGWHYFKNVYPHKRYGLGSPWQEQMYKHHVLGEPQKDLWRHDARTYPDKTVEVGNTEFSKIKAVIQRLKDSIQAGTSDKELTYIHEKLVAVASLYEIEKKPVEAINLGEWEYLVIGYRELNEPELSLRAARVAYDADDSFRSQVRLAGAYEFAGDYSEAHKILSKVAKHDGVEKLLNSLAVKRFINEHRRK